MGLFSGIKTLVMGSEKGMDIAVKTTDGIIAGLDKLKFTQEEKFDAWKDVAKVHLDIVKATAGENNVRSMTRRLLALILIGTYTLLMVFACMVWKWCAAWSVFIVTTANNSNLGRLTLWFGIFYVGYYGVSNIIENAKKK